MSVNERIKDAYEIMINFSSKNVHILLTMKTELAGFITEAIYENNKIRGWKFVSNNNAAAYQKTENSNLVQTV